jgi:iron complex outermembrane receptor protein
MREIIGEKMSQKSRYQIEVGVVVISAFITATTAMAADTAPTSAPPVSAPAAAKQASGALEQIVVTAERKSTRLEKTPVTVTSLGAAALQSQSIHTEADLQRSVPGLVTRASLDANQLDFAIRGQSIDAFSASQPSVQTYVDEVPVTGGTASTFYDLNSVQVLKGPQGTLFGRNTTGGAVIYTTAQPTYKFGGYLDTRLGDYDLRETQGAINIPIVDQKLAVRLAADGDWQTGYTTNLRDNTTVGDVNRKGLRGTVLFQATQDISDTLVVDYTRTTGSGTPGALYHVNPLGASNGGIPENNTGTVFFSPLLDSVFGPGSYAKYLAANPGAYPPGVTAYLALQRARGPFLVDLNGDPSINSSNFTYINTTKWDVTPDFALKNIIGYVRTRVNQSNIDWDGSPFLLEGTGPNDFNQDTRQITEEVQAAGKVLGGNLDYVFGFYYENDVNYNLLDVDFFGIKPVFSAHNNYINSYTNQSEAVYGQATYKLADLTGVQGLSFTGGLRGTHYDSQLQQLPGSVFYDNKNSVNSASQRTNQPSYQFGIQEQIDPNLLVYIVTRRSFRNGGFTTSGPTESPDPTSNGGNEFNPEIARDVELGEKFQGSAIGIPVRFNLALYDMWIDYVQRTDYVTTPQFGIVGLTANVPQATIRGLEAETEILPTPWLTIGVQMSYSDAGFNQNTVTIDGSKAVYGPYPDTPRWTTDAFGQITIPTPANVGTLTLRSDFFAQSSFYFGSLNNTTEPGTRIAGYGLLNFRLALNNIAESRFSLSAYLQNALNKTYYVGGIPTTGVYSTDEAVPGAPRTFYFQLHYDF